MTDGRAGKVCIWDIATKQHQLLGVKRACGEFNLYKSVETEDPMKVEKLFSALESRAGRIIKRIRDSCAANRDCIHLHPHDYAELYKFMLLSDHRSKWLKNEFMDHRRENNHVFRRYFEKTEGDKEERSPSVPELIWLGRLRYMLETSHDDLLAAASLENAMPDVQTYKYYFEEYELHIWKAEESRYFLLNDKFVEFEGDTDIFLTCNPQQELCHSICENRMHIWLPISPKVALVFCMPASCWQSAFEHVMKQAGIPWPDTSLLAKAPHKDPKLEILQTSAGKDAQMWRVNIAVLPKEFHRVLTSYTLAHARNFIVLKDVSTLEPAIRDLDSFSEERKGEWKAIGRRWTQPTPEVSIDEMVAAVFAKVHAGEDLPRTRNTVISSFYTVSMLSYVGSKEFSTKDSFMDETGPRSFIKLMEQEFPPKPAGYTDLLSLTFFTFVLETLNEAHFMKLMNAIDEKLVAIAESDNFKAAWDECKEPTPMETPPKDDATDDMIHNNIGFQSMYRAASAFGILRWLYDKRQDILVRFMEPFMEPMHRPEIMRIRFART